MDRAVALNRFYSSLNQQPFNATRESRNVPLNVFDGVAAVLDFNTCQCLKSAQQLVL